MNIWIFNHYASTLALGGAETRHIEFGHAFVKKGHKVRIFVGSYSHLTGDRMRQFCSPFAVADETGSLHFHSFETRRYESNGLDRFLASIDYYRAGMKTIGEQRIEKPDVIIASSPHPYAWKIGWKIAEELDTKLIVEVRDVWPRDLISAGKLSRRNPVSSLFRSIEKKAYLKSRKIVSLLPNIEEHVNSVTKQNLKDRIVFIPNGINISRFVNPKITKEVTEIVERFSSKKIIAYLGSHGPTNDLETVLKGIKEFNDKRPESDCNFAFIGQGSEKKRLIELSESLALDKVLFFEQIPKESVPGLLSVVDALIFPLVKFDIDTPAVSSYKLLDYMASGKPVISADLLGLPLKETSEAEFYEPGNPDSFSSALERLVNKLDKGETLCRKNMSYVREKRDIVKLAEQYERVLIDD